MTPAGTIARFFREAPSGSVIATVGTSGTGKTRAVQTADRAGAFRRRVVFDPYAWTDVGALQRGQRAFPWPGQVVTPRELAESPDLLDADPLALVVAPRNLHPKALGEAFAVVADLVWHTGGVDLIAEEAGIYSREAVAAVMRMASGGRHVRSRLVLIAQSLTRLGIDCRRHLTAAVVFAQGEPIDLDELRKRAGRRFASAVQRLRVGDGKCLFWRQGDPLDASEQST